VRALDRALIHGLFFASGASALVYQVVWVRRLALILGASHHAVSIVLAAFMGGLALGGVALGRRAARRAQPLRLYGWLELGIAACAVALPFVLHGVQALYVAIALALEDSAGGAPFAAAARVLLSFAVLAVPTFLMGGTLPVLVAALVQRHADLHARLASLYAINTAGAAFGALAAGFLLLPALGVVRTEWLAAAANVAIAAVAIARARGLERVEPEAAEPVPAARAVAAPAGDEREATLRLVFAGTALCGFGSLAFEVMWTRAISIVIGSSVYSFTVMLVAFLTGIAAGSALHAALPRRLSLGTHFALLLAGIAISTLAVSLAIPQLPALAAQLKPVALGAQFDPWTALGLCFAVMLVPCVLHGMAFPLAGEARARLEARTARSVGELVGLNTAGSIAGSLAAGFVLIPYVGLQSSLLGISALYAVGAVMVAASALAAAGVWRRVALATGVALTLAWLALATLAADPWDARRLGAFKNNESADLRRAREADTDLPDVTMLYYREGRGSTVSVVEDLAGVRRLQIDGKPVASDASSDLRHELLLGHLPVLAHPAPRTALVVGLGAGITLGGVAAHPGLDAIDIVEIEPAVVEASRLFSHLHGDPLRDARVRLLLQDGRNHLLTTRRRYDVITSDPIHPWARGSAYLYTTEYYQLARERLAPGGVMCQWLPLYQLGDKDLRAAVGSFVDVFPEATLWSTPADAVLIGTTGPLRVDLGDWQRRMAEPQVHDGLARVGLDDPLSLLGEYTLSPQGMRRFAEGAVRNTDDNLFLEFDSPRHMGGGGALLASNSQRITSLAESPAPSVAAATPLFRTHEAAARAIEAVRAARLELARVVATPQELAARVAALRPLAQGPPPYGPARDELAWQLRLVGRGALAQRDAASARAAFAESTRLSPLDWRSRVESSWALRALGDLAGAEASLRAALLLAPHAAPAHYELAGLLASDGRHDEAIAHFRAAAAARPAWADPRNDLAWLLATDPEGNLEQRAEALSLAESAVALSSARDPQILDTLAVAYAASGRVDAARDAAARAVAVARELRPDLVTRLEARSAAIARGEMPDLRQESTP
jgi:spermidine synthase